LATTGEPLHQPRNVSEFRRPFNQGVGSEYLLEKSRTRSRQPNDEYRVREVTADTLPRSNKIACKYRALKTEAALERVRRITDLALF
jgi:hypothetical protein